MSQPTKAKPNDAGKEGKSIKCSSSSFRIESFVCSDLHFHPYNPTRVHQKSIGHYDGFIPTIAPYLRIAQSNRARHDCVFL